MQRLNRVANLSTWKGKVVAIILRQLLILGDLFPFLQNDIYKKSWAKKSSDQGHDRGRPLC